MSGKTCFILDYNIVSPVIRKEKSLCFFPLKNYTDELYEESVDTLRKELEQYFGKRYSKKIDSNVQLSIFCIENMIDQNLSKKEKSNFGVFIGNNYAGWEYVEEQMLRMYKGEKNSINPYVATAWFPAATQGEISIRNQLKKVSKTFSVGQLSSAISIEFAINQLHQNKLKYAFAGGHESLHSGIILSEISDVGIVQGNKRGSQAAAYVLLSNENNLNKKPMAVVAGTSRGSSIKMALSMLSKEIDLGSITCCVMPSCKLTSADSSSVITDEILCLSDYIDRSAIFIESNKHLGEICSASFSVQVVAGINVLTRGLTAIASFPIMKNQSKKVENYIEGNVLIVGRSLDADDYFLLCLSSL